MDKIGHAARVFNQLCPWNLHYWKNIFFQPESSLKIDNSVLGHKHGLTNQGVKSQGRLTTSIFGSEEVCMDLALSIPWALL